MQYRTRQGDILDRICREYYQRVDVIPQVLEANPHLSDYGAVLPAGIVIELPEVSQPVDNSTVKLWD